jgi:anti-anti-sigma factor
MEPDIIVTPLAEPLTDLTRARLRSTIRKEIARGNLLHVIDLSELAQLDTGTLSEIIRVRRWLRDVSGYLVLVADQPHILKILTIAGLDRIIGVYPTKHEAFGAFGVRGVVPA